MLNLECVWKFVMVTGYRAADLMTRLTSAHRNDLDVWAYVKDVLDRLLSCSVDYESMRPNIWKLSHADSIRTYRVERREQAARRDRARLERRLRRLDDQQKS